MQANQPYQVAYLRQTQYIHLDILLRAYQPIIGPVALSLYQTLLQTPLTLKQVSRRQLHSHLLESLNVGMNELEEARLKLEGIGLLETYRQKDSHQDYRRQTILYFLNPPLSWNNFFSHPLYSALLYKQLGQETYDLLVQTQTDRTIDNDRYQDITVSFDQVFHLNEGQTWHAQTQARPINTENSPQSEADSFDYSRYLEYIMAEGILHSELTNDLKDYVISMHRLYDLDELDMVRLTSLATNHLTGHVQVEKMKDIVDRHAYFVNKHQRNAKRKSENNLEDVKKRIAKEYPQLNPKDIHVLALCQEIPTEEFLKQTKRAKNGFATDSERFYVRDLKDKTHLSEASINFLVYYLLVICKRPNLYKSDLQRYANEWQQAKLNSTIDILDHVRRQETEKSRKNYKQAYGRGTHQEIRPTWLDEKEEPEEAPVTKTNNEAKIQARLDQLFKEDD